MPIEIPAYQIMYFSSFYYFLVGGSCASLKALTLISVPTSFSRLFLNSAVSFSFPASFPMVFPLSHPLTSSYFHIFCLTSPPSSRHSHPVCLAPLSSFSSHSPTLCIRAACSQGGCFSQTPRLQPTLHFPCENFMSQTFNSQRVLHYTHSPRDFACLSLQQKSTACHVDTTQLWTQDG